MNMLVSVIVPIYNREKYIERCIKSIQEQTYRNLEIILVDDGSTDASGRICDNYATLDKRIKVIHKENGGVTSSRKAGVEAANGQYIGFVDSDDWIEAPMYEEMLKSIEENDCNIACFARKLEINGICTLETELIGAGVHKVNEYVLDNMILYKDSSRPGITYSNCNKLYESFLIKENYCKVDDSVVYMEDAVVTWSCIMDSSKIIISDSAYYHYCVQSESATQKRNSKFFIGVSGAYNYFANRLREKPHSDVLEYKLDKCLMELVLYGLLGKFAFFKSDKLFPGYIFSGLNGKKNEKIVLYGAGNVGKAARKYMNNLDISAILWVDKNKELWGNEIRPVEEIITLDFDCVYIAVFKEEVATVITEELKSLGVDETKILWEKPIPLFDFLYGK